MVFYGKKLRNTSFFAQLQTIQVWAFSKKLVLLVFSSQNSHPSYHFANLVVDKTGILLGLRQNCELLRFLPLFVPKTRGSLDYARDDGTFYSVIQSEAKHVIQRAFDARRNSGNGFISWKGYFPLPSFRPNEVRGEIPQGEAMAIVCEVPTPLSFRAKRRISWKG